MLVGNKERQVKAENKLTNHSASDHPHLTAQLSDPCQGYAYQQAIRAKCFHPSGTFVEFPEEDIQASIPARFEKVVRMYPDRTAVKTEAGQLTYDDLNKRANRLAHDLLARRESVPEPVALFLDHWDAFVVAHLAVLKAGKFSLGLDPAAELKRTTHLINDSGARVIVVEKDTIKQAHKLVSDECLLIDVNDLTQDLSEDNPEIHIAGEALSYVRYTSGSTGSAKGAMKSHRHALKAVRDFVNHFHICPVDRITILEFASTGKHLFKALLTGACFCPYEARKKGLIHLLDWMRQEKITLYYSFPTALRYFLNSISDSEVLPDLRLVELEGEPVYRSDVAMLKKHVSPNCILVNTFSSAETGTVSLYFVDMRTSVNTEKVPVGYPVEGVEVLILDDAGQPLEFNEVGEVGVRSSFLSGGYWQKPDVTSQRFIAQSNEEKGVTYLSGDLGCLSHDGCLHLFGRKDFQVKIRSFRVDVSEVEAALKQHNAIQSVAVTGRNDHTGNRKLVAYVVPRSQQKPTVAAIRLFLWNKLPEYMIPSEFVFLDELPLMSTGKINRHALPEPSSVCPERAMDRPRTPVENSLAEIWAEVLSVREVGIYNNFFELGGHSLAASQVISRVIRAFNLELPIKALFDAPTVAEMAVIITQNQAKRASATELAQMLHEVEAITEEEAQRSAEEIKSTVVNK